MQPHVETYGKENYGLVRASLILGGFEAVQCYVGLVQKLPCLSVPSRDTRNSPGGSGNESDRRYLSSTVMFAFFALYRGDLMVGSTA